MKNCGSTVQNALRAVEGVISAEVQSLHPADSALPDIF